MPVESASDRAAFFDADDFGQVADFGGGLLVSVVFDTDYVEVLGVATYAPLITGPTDQLSTVTRGQSVTLNAQVYTVQEIQPDGTGITQLILSKN